MVTKVIYEVREMNFEPGRSCGADEEKRRASLDDPLASLRAGSRGIFPR
jgi:hypothetical protein